MIRPARKTIIINLFGGPGLGKSILAAALYADLKCEGRSAELIREFAKDFNYLGRNIDKNQQVAILGEQLARESLLYGKVDFAITDSPVFLSAIYETHYLGDKYLTNAVLGIKNNNEKDGIRYLNFFLSRESEVEYEAEGRYEKLEQAKKVDIKIQDFLNEHGIPFITIPEMGISRHLPLKEANKENLRKKMDFILEKMEKHGCFDSVVNKEAA
jgi:hypothetical protein